MSAVSSTPLAEYDPFDPRELSCPHAAWSRLRRESPIHPIRVSGAVHPVYLLTRRRDIEEVARRTGDFSGRPDPSAWRYVESVPEFEAVMADGGYRMAHTFVTSDPPQHAAYRRVAVDYLSPARIEGLGPDISALVDELLEALPNGEAVEFMQAYAVPLPLRVIGVLLALPRDDHDFLFAATNAHMAMIDPSVPVAIAAQLAPRARDCQKYLVEKILGYRDAPAANFLSHIANARGDDGQPMSIEEVLSMAFNAVIAGNETTRNAIGTAAFLLARDRSLWARLQQSPERIPAFVEEAIRIGGPSNTTVRTVVRDTEIDGVRLPAGASLFLMWGSGSLDETVFECPERVDLERRNTRLHTSFGIGPKVCPGSHLARSELQLSVAAWLRAFASFELAVAEEEVCYAPAFAFRGPAALPLRMTRR